MRCSRNNGTWSSIFNQTIHIVFVCAIHNEKAEGFDMSFFESACCEMGTDSINKSSLRLLKGKPFVTKMRGLCKSFTEDLNFFHTTAFNASQTSSYKSCLGCIPRKVKNVVSGILPSDHEPVLHLTPPR